MNIGTKFLVCFFILSFAYEGNAQKDYGKLYTPNANAQEDINLLLTKAKAEQKHVLLQVGGNWCVWCYRFHDFILSDEKLKAMVEDNFLIYHLNYSPENKNEDILAAYQFPQRFGFPVLVVLDENGNLLHTQDSGLLESGEGYDAKKVTNFFRLWSRAALDPATYSPEKK